MLYLKSFGEEHTNNPSFGHIERRGGNSQAPLLAQSCNIEAEWISRTSRSHSARTVSDLVWGWRGQVCTPLFDNEAAVDQGQVTDIRQPCQSMLQVI